MSRRISRYEQFYLESRYIVNQQKKKDAQETKFQIFESKASKGRNLDLVEVLLEKEVYRDGKVNESYSKYLFDEKFKNDLRHNSCAGFVSHGISELKKKTMDFLIESRATQKEINFIDSNFDAFLLGDQRIVEGFLKWIGQGVASTFAPFVDLILKPGWKALKSIGSSMFGEEVMNKIQEMGESIVKSITDGFDKIDQKFQTVLDKTWSGIKSIAQKIGEFLKTFWETCKKVFSMIWGFIKDSAKSAFSSATNNSKFKKLSDLAKQESVSGSAKGNEVQSEAKEWIETIKSMFGVFEKGPQEAGFQNTEEINQSGKKTFNPEGNTKVGEKEEKNESFGGHLRLIYGSLLYELKTNQLLTIQEVVDLKESGGVYEAHEEGFTEKDMTGKGKEGEIALRGFREILKSLRMSNNYEDTLSAIKGIKTISEKEGVNVEEVAKLVDGLVKGDKDKTLAKFIRKEYEDETKQKEIQKVIKSLGGIEYDPTIDFDDDFKKKAEDFFANLKINAENTTYLLCDRAKKTLKSFDSDQYLNIDKLCKFKYNKNLSKYFKKIIEDNSSQWTKDNKEIQIFLAEEKKKKNIPDEFKVDSFYESDEKTQESWTKFKEMWDKKDLDEIQKLLLSVDNEELYSKLDDICRQELKFSLKKKLVDKFEGWFTGKATKENLKKIDDHLKKFANVYEKDEEKAEESGVIKKWCQTAIGFLLSPFGKLVEIIGQAVGTATICVGPWLGTGLSWKTVKSKFGTLAEVLACVIGIGIDGYCAWKGYKSLGSHENKEHASPEGFMSFIGAPVSRLKHAAHEVESGIGLGHHESVTEIKTSSAKYVKTKYVDFITESNEKPKEESKGFPFKSIATIGGSLLISYIGNLLSVSFPPVGVVLEVISLLLIVLHLCSVLANSCNIKWLKWADVPLNAVGLGHDHGHKDEKKPH